MAYKLRLLWHANPDFYAILTAFIWGGGGLQFVDNFQKLELFAMGPVQLSLPRGVAEILFTKLDFGEHFVSFPRKTAQHRVH